MNSFASNADMFTEEVFSQHKRFKLLGRGRLRSAARDWFEVFILMKESGKSDEVARAAADGKVQSTFNPMLWLAIGELIVKLLYAWWKKKHPDSPGSDVLSTPY